MLWGMVIGGWQQNQRRQFGLQKGMLVLCLCAMPSQCYQNTEARWSGGVAWRPSYRIVQEESGVCCGWRSEKMVENHIAVLSFVGEQAHCPVL